MFSRTSSFTSISGPYCRSHETSASFRAEQDFKIDSLENFRKNLIMKCISNMDVEFLSNSRTRETTTNYQSASKNGWAAEMSDRLIQLHMLCKIRGWFLGQLIRKKNIDIPLSILTGLQFQLIIVRRQASETTRWNVRFDDNVFSKNLKTKMGLLECWAGFKIP